MAQKLFAIFSSYSQKVEVVRSEQSKLILREKTVEEPMTKSIRRFKMFFINSIVENIIRIIIVSTLWKRKK